MLYIYFVIVIYTDQTQIQLKAIWALEQFNNVYEVITFVVIEECDLTTVKCVVLMFFNKILLYSQTEIEKIINFILAT